MKKLIIIPFILISLALSAKTIYVSTTGSDSDAGTLAAPYLTIQYAIDQLREGDTLFIRSGVYYPTSYVQIDTYSGTESNPICVFGYPSDVLAGNKPVIDCDNLYQSSGLALEDVDYWILKDFDVRNARQDGATVDMRGVQAYGCLYVYFINIGSYGHGGPGFELSNAGGTHQTIGYFINCDSYNNCDTISDGNDADGFGNNGYYWWTGDSINMRLEDTTKWVKGYYINCRAWNNSDDGFGHAYGSYAYHENCYSINNGNVVGMTGDGRGFTVGHQYYTPPDNQYTFTNCLSAYNGRTGFRINSSGEIYSSNVKFYNNTALYNHSGFNTNVVDGLETHPVIYRNNIAFPHDDSIGWWPDYDAAFVLDPAFYPTYDHNSWDIEGITLTADDFILLDTTGCTAPRQVDGSLPDNDFYNYYGHLSPTSDLIDVGINVGLPFGGSAPDLGAFEYDGQIDSTLTDILTFTLADQTGAATINTTTHTVSIEVAYTADVTDLSPTITMSYGATISPASGTARDFTTPQTYTVTALDGTTTQEWTVTVTQAEEPAAPAGSSRIVKFRGEIMKL
jgi:hypothetical protein